MKRYLLQIACLSLLILSACDVHEWPVLLEKEHPVMVHLNYNTEMATWNHWYNGKTVEEQSLGGAESFLNTDGLMRYIVRSYPVVDKKQTSREHTQEDVSMKVVEDGYDNAVQLKLRPGNYKVMVWSDMVMTKSDQPYYNADDFSEIYLDGKHVGSTDYKDAYKGWIDLEVLPGATNQVELKMQRPLARFEFIATDAQEFIAKEESKSNKKVSMDDYKVVFSYVGFMPNTYSLFTDKPVDSSTNVSFESKLSKLSDTEVSMGFDYVFVNDKESRITLQIAIYNNQNVRIMASDPISVPLQRNRNTLVRGNFLMLNASGGIQVDPGYSGDHNMVLP